MQESGGPSIKWIPFNNLCSSKFHRRIYFTTALSREEDLLLKSSRRFILGENELGYTCNIQAIPMNQKHPPTNQVLIGVRLVSHVLHL